MRNADWRDEAACDYRRPNAPHPDVFFTNRTTGRAVAIATCRQCPVAAACLQDALTHPEWAANGSGLATGVRGGLTNEQQARLLKKNGGPRRAPVQS